MDTLNKEKLTNDEFTNIWLGYYSTKQKYKKFYQFDHEGHANRVIIDNIEFVEPIHIYDYIDEDDYFLDILILNSKIPYLHIEHIKTGDITISNTEIGHIELEKSLCGILSFEDLKGLEEIVFFIMTLPKVIFEELDIRKKVAINNCGIDELVVTNYSKKIQINIDDGSGISNLTIAPNSTISMDLEDSQIGTLQIKHGVITRDSIIKINNCKINIFLFESTLNLGVISLKGIKPINYYTKWHIKKRDHKYYRDDKHKYSINRIERNSEVQFLHSDLGKFSMIECELEKFNKFVFFNTKILEMFIAGTKLPTIISVPEEYQNESLEQQRLGFSQFKKIFENRGDSVSASIYQAKELDIYRELLTQEKKSLSIFTRDWFNNFGERTNLMLNRFSNYYGNNWLRSTIVTLIATFFFFTVYSFLLGNRLGNDFQLFFKLFSYSFEFINPLRKSTELENVIKITDNENWLSLARTWDYISRIFLAYFVYQTVQAFRKFGKKS
ncbi:hypothetical protein [Arcicella rosea]|uniref:Uncharacterized protein n=1 Tax=Arcicella rosea TaxID=502909 RepID=A0A841EPA3_9BACT|nr:hypothetical protein [Arcicella rosea]MBB6004746.1 hypothetical protein [Arcicella rosea]